MWRGDDAEVIQIVTDKGDPRLVKVSIKSVCHIGSIYTWPFHAIA